MKIVIRVSVRRCAWSLIPSQTLELYNLESVRLSPVLPCHNTVTTFVPQLHFNRNFLGNEVKF